MSVVTPVVITVRLLARPAADVIAFAKVTDFPPVDASVADFVRVTSPPYECVPEVVTSALTAVVPVINKFERPLTAPLTTASLITVKLCPAPVTVDCVVTAEAVRVMSERSATAPLYVCAPDDVTSALTAVVPVINKFERPLTAPLTTASLITVKLCPAPVTVDCVVTADAVRVMSERSVTAPLYVCAPDDVTSAASCAAPLTE